MRTGLRAGLGTRLPLRLGTHMPRLAFGWATIRRGIPVVVGDAVASAAGTSASPTPTAATTTPTTTATTATNALAILFPRRARRVIVLIARNAPV